MNLYKLVGAAAVLSAVASGAVRTQVPAGPIVPKGAAQRANSDGVYLALRSALPTGDGVQVKGFTLNRQGGVFHFAQGNFFFYAPVNGKVTGAVFVGTGHFDLAPHETREQHSLALLTKSGVMAQDFTTLVMRFTDGTAVEIRKASTGSAGAATSQAGSVAADLAKGFRQKLHENLELRLLSDVLISRPSQLFLASFRMGGTFTGRNVLFVVDPESIPDQVELDTWGDEGQQTWAGYRMDAQPDDEGVPERVTA